MSAADRPCQRCGCALACHRRGMQWGQVHYGQCRHCLACTEFAEPGTEIPDPTGPAPGDAELIDAYDAWMCERCSSRYGQPYPDHACGELTEVTVTITRKTATGAIR